MNLNISVYYFKNLYLLLNYLFLSFDLLILLSNFLSLIYLYSYYYYYLFIEYIMDIIDDDVKSLIDTIKFFVENYKNDSDDSFLDEYL